MNIDGYETDKDASGYLPTYQGLAATLRPDAAICELGVAGGGSLALWRKLFPNAAVIVGVDKEIGASWPPGTVKVVADQQDPTLPDQLTAFLVEETAPPWLGYDLIVDDASHLGHHTYKSLQHLFPLVAPGGYYCIEDWCVWNDRFPTYDNSMLAFSQMLPTFFDGPDTDVHFITLSYGLIIIRKKGDVGAEPVRGDAQDLEVAG